LGFFLWAFFLVLDEGLDATFVEGGLTFDSFFIGSFLFTDVF
jgi:hypothetical protein